MKKRIMFAVLAVVVSVSICFAGNYDQATKAISSGEKTEDAQIRTGRAALTSVMVITDGTNAATLTVHDGTSNSDKKIGEFKCDGASYYCGWLWNFPAEVSTGIYCDVTGTGASYILEYIRP
jgi:hypothetical protein